MIRLPVYLTSCSSMPSASRRAISDCSTAAASALTCAAVRNPFANARAPRASFVPPVLSRPRRCRHSAHQRNVLRKHAGFVFAKLRCCRPRGCTLPARPRLGLHAAELLNASASRNSEESSSHTTSPALTLLPSGRIEMIVSGGGAVVGIDTLVRKRRTKRDVRLDDVFKASYRGPARGRCGTESFGTVEDETKAERSSAGRAPPRFPVRPASAAPPSLDFAVATLWRRRRSPSPSFAMPKRRRSHRPSMRSWLGRPGSALLRAAPTGSRRNDSTRHLTRSSTELSRTPVSVTTWATSPWSTSTVVARGRSQPRTDRGAIPYPRPNPTSGRPRIAKLEPRHPGTPLALGNGAIGLAAICVSIIWARSRVSRPSLDRLVPSRILKRNASRRRGGVGDSRALTEANEVQYQGTMEAPGREACGRRADSHTCSLAAQYPRSAGLSYVCLTDLEKGDRLVGR